MADPKLVNIGTKENPVLVSANAIGSDLGVQEKYWRGVASGSTLPSSNSEMDQEALDLLLKDKT